MGKSVSAARYHSVLVEVYTLNILGKRSFNNIILRQKLEVDCIEFTNDSFSFLFFWMASLSQVLQMFALFK